jgi:hypothetical protein
MTKTNHKTMQDTMSEVAELWRDEDETPTATLAPRPWDARRGPGPNVVRGVEAPVPERRDPWKGARG